MSKKILPQQPCFYHPVKIIFLDDNQLFLNALSFEFEKNENMIMLTNPDEALGYIRLSKDRVYELNSLKNSNNEDYIQPTNMFGFLNIIYDQSRFNNVSVLVIDYKMPDINGIEFCEKIKDKTIYKILLTAEADKDIAISAFNNGTIDKFIMKTNNNLYAELLASIDELTNKYFSELSKFAMSIGGDSLRALLNYEPYRKVFHKVQTKYQAVEYYLLDHSGSVLFLAKNGKPTWLLVCDQYKANEHVDLLSGYGFSSDFIQRIKNQESILFFLSDSEYMESASQWKKYIFDTEKLDDNFCYSVVNASLAGSIDWNAVVSYQEKAN